MVQMQIMKLQCPQKLFQSLPRDLYLTSQLGYSHVLASTSYLHYLSVFHSREDTPHTLFDKDNFIKVTMSPPNTDINCHPKNVCI